MQESRRVGMCRDSSRQQRQVLFILNYRTRSIIDLTELKIAPVLRPEVQRAGKRRIFIYSPPSVSG